MNVSDETIQKFIDLTEKESGEKLSWKEGKESAEKFINLIKTLLIIDQRQRKAHEATKSTQQKGGRSGSK